MATRILLTWAELEVPDAAAGGTPFPIAGESTGTSAGALAGLTVSHAVTGQSAGTSAASLAGLTVSHPISGVSVGTSDGVLARLIVAHPIAGVSVGTSDGSLALSVGGQFYGGWSGAFSLASAWPGMPAAESMAVASIVQYVGDSVLPRLWNLRLGGALVTDETAGVTITYTVVDKDGTEYDGGAFSYVTKAVGTPPVSTSFWEAEIVTPDIPNQVAHVHVVAEKGRSTRKWHGTIRAKAFV